MVLVCPREVRGSGLEELQSAPLQPPVFPTWGLRRVKSNLPLLFVFVFPTAQLV